MIGRKSNGQKTFDVINNGVILIFLFITIYPLWYVLCASFSNVFDIVNVPFLLWPRGFTLKSYAMVFEAERIWTGFLNSFLYMIFGTTLNIAMTLMAAYPLSRESLPGKKWISKLLIISMYISGGMIPLYLVVDGLGLRDTLLAMILPNAVSVFFIIVAISFLRSTIPESIQEAARIDGASHVKTFLLIIVPLSAPLIGALAFQFALGHWNSYTQAMIYLDDEKLYPLQLVLREILIRADSSMVSSMMMKMDIDYTAQTELKEGFKYVSMVVSSVPLLVIYPFLRRYFEKGLFMGGIKE